MKPRVDLHVHSTVSDGLLEPDEVVRRAAASGVEVMALTDHDTTEGIPRARRAAAEVGVRLIAGLEISTQHGDQPLHMLAYFPQHDPQDLEAFRESRRQARWARLDAMLERLQALGVPVTREDLGHDGDPGRTPGRPLIARAMIRLGHVGSFREAFDRWLARGQPAYVADRVPTAAEAIGLAHDLGGLAVVAHPGVDDLDSILEALVGLGLDGVEAYHGSHSVEQRAQYAAFAAEQGLLCTGGSDFHGDDPAQLGSDPTARTAPSLGELSWPLEAWERFEGALLG